MASAASAKGESYLKEGNATLQKSSMFSVFGIGKYQKYEDAAELFTKAGNAFKLANQWQSAGNAFIKAANSFEQTETPNDAVNSYIEAANAFKKINPEEAIQAYDKAINIYNDGGRFAMSARYYKEVAEMYEADNNFQGAIDYYQSAADIFNGDNKKQNGNQCLLKIATLLTSKNEYSRASSIFETIARESMESRLGAFSAKGYFFQSLLCHLAAGDNVAVSRKLEEFKSVDYSFGSSRECSFTEKLLEALEQADVEAFETACAEFDRISPLDPWKTSILLAAKNHITSSSDGDVDLA